MGWFGSKVATRVFNISPFIAPAIPGVTPWAHVVCFSAGQVKQSITWQNIVFEARLRSLKDAIKFTISFLFFFYICCNKHKAVWYSFIIYQIPDILLLYHRVGVNLQPGLLCTLSTLQKHPVFVCLLLLEIIERVVHVTMFDETEIIPNKKYYHDLHFLWW